MECPHCGVEIDTKPHVFALGEDRDGTWQIFSSRCPACDRLLVDVGTTEGRVYPAWPGYSRPRLSDDIPRELEAEYRTAARILADSPEASAALSRRLLQRFLTTHVGMHGGGLAEQVRRTADSEQMPPYLSEALRTLSVVAKLESNANKSLRPEALTAVEPGEPEWLLDILQSLFELYFVQPARLRRKLDALEARIGPTAAPAKAAPVEAATLNTRTPGAATADSAEVPIPDAPPAIAEPPIARLSRDDRRNQQVPNCQQRHRDHYHYPWRSQQ